MLVLLISDVSCTSKGKNKGCNTVLDCTHFLNLLFLLIYCLQYHSALSSYMRELCLKTFWTQLLSLITEANC